MLGVPEKLSGAEPLDVLRLLEIFPDLGEYKEMQLRNAVGAAVERKYKPGQTICREGEFGTTAFYVVEGRVQVRLATPIAGLKTTPKGLGFFRSMKSSLVGHAETASNRTYINVDAPVDLPRNRPIAELGEGDLFGEMACRTQQPRAATVAALTETRVVEMQRVILDMLLGSRVLPGKVVQFKGTAFKKKLDEIYRARALATHLRSIPLFNSLDDAFIEHLRLNAELISCAPGEVIIKQGDPSDAFYLVRMGLVRVGQSWPGGELVINYLGRGDYFGEIGLLKKQTRNATCSALDAVDLVRIKSEDFQHMLDKFPAIRQQLEVVGEQRLEADSRLLKKLPEGLQLDEYLNQGLYEAQNLLLIDLDRCTRCDACVNACADAHDGVSRLIRDGLRYDRFLVATACRSCRDPLCMTQCPVGSIQRNTTLEIRIEDWCIGCGMCAQLCPYGNISMHEFGNSALLPESLSKITDNIGTFAKKLFTSSKPVMPVAAAAPLPVPAPLASASKAAAPAALKVEAAETAAKAGAAEAARTAPSADVKPAAPPAAKPAATAPAPKPTSALLAQKAGERAVESYSKVKFKATTCDLCTQLTTPSCVYACPHEAAKRVDPTRFFSREIGRQGTFKRRVFNPFRGPADRTTH